MYHWIHHLVRPAALLLALGLGPAAAVRAEDTIRACATVPDLGDLIRRVGGERVEVTVFAKGPQDPHFVEARPSFIRELHRAELFAFVGLELEKGWAPALLRSARNGRVTTGKPGHVDCSSAIEPRKVPGRTADRSRGDLHVYGNPHYLLDPLAGWRVARLLRERLATIRPDSEEAFARGFAEFERDLAAALLGKRLAARYAERGELGKLLELLDRGGRERFLEFLGSQDERELLGGWLAALAPHAGAPVVADHDLWPYFTARFDLRMVAFLEPKPGIQPTTRHLAEVVRTVEREEVEALLSAVYFDRRHARFLARHAGVEVVPAAHQVGSRDGTDDYIAMIDHNVRELAAAFEAGDGDDESP